MKTNLIAIIFSTIIFVISFSNATFANIAAETSTDSTNMIAWADDNEEDSPELLAKVKELNKKWGNNSSDSKNYSNDNKKYSDDDLNVKRLEEQRENEKELEKRLKEIDEKYTELDDRFKEIDKSFANEN